MDNDSLNYRHQDSHQDAEYRRVELITGVRRRRDWTPDEKAEIVAASMVPGSTIVDVARRYQVSRGLLWTWRRKAMAALTSETAPHFIPLRIAGEPRESVASISDLAAPAVDRPQLSGSIEIEVGRTRVRVQGVVDPDALRQVLGVIGAMR